jgi:hypothetical protein
MTAPEAPHRLHPLRPEASPVVDVLLIGRSSGLFDSAAIDETALAGLLSRLMPDIPLHKLTGVMDSEAFAAGQTKQLSEYAESMEFAGIVFNASRI